MFDEQQSSTRCHSTKSVKFQNGLNFDEVDVDDNASNAIPCYRLRCTPHVDKSYFALQFQPKAKIFYDRYNLLFTRLAFFSYLHFTCLLSSRFPIIFRFFPRKNIIKNCKMLIFIRNCNESVG